MNYGYSQYYQDPNNGAQTENYPPCVPPPPPYWDAYGMYSYYYTYPPVYSPYPFYHPYEVEPNSGNPNEEKNAETNSTPEELNKVIAPQIIVTPTRVEQGTDVTSPRVSEYDEELESEGGNDSFSFGLQTIKSVTNIKVYEELGGEPCDECIVEEVDSDGTTEENDDDSHSVYIVDDDSNLRQLSTIYEESERSDRFRRESSVTTTVSEDLTYNAEDSCIGVNFDSVVNACPVTFNFSLLDKKNVTERGDMISETPVLSVKTEALVEHNSYDYNDNKQNINIGEEQKEEDGDDEEEQDWWGLINKDDNDDKHINTVPTNCDINDTAINEYYNTNNNLDNEEDPMEEVKAASEEGIAEDEDNTTHYNINNNFENEEDPRDEVKAANEEVIAENEDDTTHNVEESEEIDFWATLKSDNSDRHADVEEYDSEDDDTDSTSSSDSSCCTSNVSEKAILEHNPNTVFEENEEIFEKSDNKEDEETSDLESEKTPSIQERIKMLQRSCSREDSPENCEEEIAPSVSVKDRVSAFETNNYLRAEVQVVRRSKPLSSTSSRKSMEYYSEEEIDSGVTSDVSRHISETDTEEFPEMRKLSKYKRAATHSRLYKLLQEECDNEEDDESTNSNRQEENVSAQQNSEGVVCRRDHLTLPLQRNTSGSESISSSGINSPGSGEFVNEKLVSELIQSMLTRKRGQVFKTVPMEKLHAAAIKILNEDVDNLDTSSEEFSSFLSPLKTGTQSSTPAQTPQEFYGNYSEYKQYYDSWGEAEKMYDSNNDVLPSKAFKLIQEHVSLNKTGTISGLLAKCPRVLSSKNVHKELLKILEDHNSSSASPDTLESVDKKEATSAS